MQEYISVLKTTALFKGLDDNEIKEALLSLGAVVLKYKKGGYVINQGEYIEKISILVKGRLIIQQDDYWGNRSIISAVEEGEMFGESFVSEESGAFPNDVVASEDSVVVSFAVSRIFEICSSTLIQNLFFSISEKNRKLMQKIGYISKRTTREKLKAYLSSEAKKNNSGTFTIPFNRQQLADFLSIDRSAMSNELCKMRDEGKIIFERNRFSLLE